MLKFVHATNSAAPPAHDLSPQRSAAAAAVVVGGCDWTDGDERLFSAVSNHQPDLVSAAVSAGANPSKLNPLGQSSLHLCCERGYLDTLKVLMASKHLNLNSVDSKGKTAVHRAVSSRQPAIAAQLLSSGAKADAADHKLMTPLHIAAMDGDTECVEIMVANGADIELRNKDGRTPLALAAMRGQVDVADVLLIHKADINTQDNKGRTPLMLAGMHGEKQMVDFLIVRDADARLVDHGGKPFIQLAIEHGQADAVAHHIPSKPPALVNDDESPQRRKQKKRPEAPPRKRTTKIDDPNSLADVINSQLSINSSSTTSSGASSSSHRLSFHDDSQDSPLPDKPQLHQKSAYVKQLESKNSHLLQQHSELQSRLAEMEKQLKNPKMSAEASNKIRHLEDTVSQLMQTIYDQQHRRFEHSSPSLLMTERGCGDGGLSEPQFHDSSNRSANTSFSDSSHSNYLNTAPFLGLEPPSTAPPHQRYSQSSDSGYCGSVALSPTDPGHRGQMKEIRGELSQVVKTLSGLVDQNSRLQETLMAQMKTLSNLTIQVATIEKSVANMEPSHSPNDKHDKVFTGSSSSRVPENKV